MDSIWFQFPSNINNHKKVDSDMSCDVTIVGGGLTGLTCSYYLSKKGIKNILLEKDTLMSKTSGNTTAKVTAQHGLFYKYLIDNFGIENAKKYLNVNLHAIKNIKNIIDTENINCDFEFQDSYVYTSSKSYVQNINDELDALKSLNFNANFCQEIPLPIPQVLCAIKFPHQAQFNPIKYAQGLNNSIINNGGILFENSQVIDIKRIKDSFFVYVNGHIITSKYVILATRYPFINFPGFYFLKMYQSLSYCSAYEIPSQNYSGIYINAETPTLSARFVKNENKNILLVSGCDHKVGIKSNPPNPYSVLNSFAHSISPGAKLISSWVTEDCISLDKLPYIGQFSSIIPNMFIATGFKKWGMTFSNIASNIIVDNILGEKNIYSTLFDSTRFHPIKNKEEMKNILKESASSLIIKKFKKPNNPTCQHLGCELSWNSVNNTWDCPCHGSRFDSTGKVLYGPSQHDLTNL